jgi:plasmid stability protein
LSVAAREEAAEKGAALPDGKLPIRNVEELKAAIRLRGKVEGHSATEIRRHIVKRARALDAVEELPAIWKQAKQAAMKGYKCAKSGAVMPAPCAGCPNPSACAI